MAQYAPWLTGRPRELAKRVVRGFDAFSGKVWRNPVTGAPGWAQASVTSEKPIALIGMSHVIALQSAMTEAERARIEVINLNSEPGLMHPRTAEIAYAAFGGLQAGHVFLSIRGQYHNILGLIEHPVPYAVGDAARGQVPEDRARHFIPEDMFLAPFAETVRANMLTTFAPIRDAVAPARVWVIAPPPPFSDGDLIRRNPGVFRERLEQGIAPISLRAKLYDLLCALFAEECVRCGIGFLPVPDGVRDADGGLPERFWHKDPTHGNSAYGRLVLDQMAASVEGVRE